MKGKDILILILNICLFLSGCGASGAVAENESYTLSETVITVQTDAVMEIRDVSPSGASVAIRNTGEKVISYGEEYAIEKEMDGDWYTVDVQNWIVEHKQFGWNDSLRVLQPGEETAEEIEWATFFGIRSPGNYRLVKHVFYLSGEEAGEGIDVAVYFEIE